MTKLRVAVLGVGHHGRHHARNLAGMPDVELVGVVDPDEHAARTVSQACQCKAYPDPRELIGQVDAAIIAVPTSQHHLSASPFLRRGVSCLVEKPLSFSIDEGRQMVRLAEKHRAQLMVGHIERFNPAWESIARLKSPPRLIRSTRLSPFPFRSLDVSVVFDVMIHDVDLILSITDSRPRTIQVVGERVLSPSFDWVDVRIEMESGAVAQLSASRTHHLTERRMLIQSPETSIDIDFLHRTSVCQLHSAGSGTWKTADPPTTPDDKDRLRSQLLPTESTSHSRDIEPLRRELDEFVQSIRESRPPLVTGEAGLSAVSVASQIESLLQNEHQSIPWRASA